MAQVSKFVAALKILFFILYPIAVTLIGVRNEARLLNFQETASVDQSRNEEMVTEQRDRPHYTFEEYLSREDFLGNKGKGMQEFQDFQHFNPQGPVYVGVPLMMVIGVGTLFICLLLFTILKRSNKKSVTTKKDLEIYDLSEEFLDNLFMKFKVRFDLDSKFENLCDELFNVTFPAVIRDIKLENNKATFIQLSNYQILNDRFANLIATIDEQYMKLNGKIQSLNFNYEPKVIQLTKEFEDLKLYNDDCLSKVNKLKWSVLSLQNEISFGESEISQPTVRSTDELKNLI